MDRHNLRTRILHSFFVTIVVTVLFAGPLVDVVNAQPANAPGAGAGGGLPVAVLADAPALAQGTYDNILTEITRAGVVAFFNALQVFFGQLAYDAASYIASGGKGQEAVYYKKGFGKYLQDVASDAAGEFIGSLSQDGDFFKKLGYDLCKPTDPRSLLKIQVGLGQFFPGLQGKFDRPRPKCNFQEVVKNYETLYQTMSNSEILSNIELSLDPNANDLGVTATIFGRSAASIRLKTDQAALERGEGQGFKAITNIVSGNIKTPSQVVSEATREEVIRHPNQSQLAATGAILTNAFKQGPIQLATYTASVFVNTLASKMLKRIFEKGLGAFDFSDVKKPDVSSPDSIVTSGKTDVRNANIDLRTPNIQKVTDVNIMSDFVACPPTNRGPWNCTVDQSLAQAIQTQSDQGGFTVKEALERNLLHADWRLIPATQNRENQDAQCYTYAYCVGNLQKLRLMRILPVGFEFAANAPENIARCSGSNGCITLGEVVQNFANCNTSGQRDASHPWCHLVDPNWVITSLPQQCVLSGFDENLLSDRLPQRTEQCQDIQTCLKRNDRGECIGGYGYCMAEKTVYRFQADECQARFASCRNYASRKGEPVSYLRNTLDYAQCSADNAGCLWYSTVRNPDGGRADNWIGTTTTGPRVYFDKTLETCPATDEGCTKLHYVTLGDSSLNLLLNPSFEQVVNNAGITSLTYWQPPAAYIAPTVPTGTASFDRSAAVEVGATPAAYLQPVVMAPNRMYTVSLYARVRNPAAIRAMTVTVSQYRDEALTTAVPASEMTRADGSSLHFRSSGCLQTPGIGMSQTTGLGENWQRFECSFLTASSTRAAEVGFGGRNTLIDAVQLEEGEFATPFVNGMNTALASVNLKVAPDEFACSGDATDHPICSKFAKVCRQVEAGCQGYTDTAAGGPEIPAIITTNDACPTSCVGYAEYRKTPSAFDLVHDVDPRFDDPTDATSSYFIPATAQSCTQADVGCEEFTNVQAAAAGGEQLAYFSYLRSCEVPNANSQTYFTWEGSDTAGYQLRTWSLIRETPDGSTPPGTILGPKAIVKRGPDQIIKEPTTCNEATWRSGLDADCRQIYDANGNVFYRYFSQTVLSTPQCTSYRLNRSGAEDCRKTFGNYDARTGECIYQVYAPESRTCSASAVSCRAFAGSLAGGTQTVLSENFRTDTGGFTNGARSSESVLVGDSSLRMDNTADFRAPVRTTVAIPTEGGLYNVSFWAKSTAATNQMFVSAANNAADIPNARLAGVVNLSSDWQRYTVGPFDASNSTTTLVVWTAPAGASSFAVFLDEVNIVRLQDVAYVRANTWNTPIECDRSLAGTPQPQAMLNCRQYTNRSQETVNVRQFTRLCRETAIGCSAFVDTRNSVDVGPQTFTQRDVPAIPGFGTATTIRAADRFVYLIDEASKRCSESNVSCRAFGKPVYQVDRQALTGMQTLYYKDDITKYDQALCKPSEIFCEEFSFGTAKEYFRDPQNHSCEYRENVPVTSAEVPALPTGNYSGWFQKGANKPCYPQSLENGINFNMLRRGDLGYADWAGMCPETAGECTEFRDTNDLSDSLYPTGKPYYFVRNDRLDTSSCAGNVDVGRGCILLRDMSDALLKYSVAASYQKYQNANFVPTPPVDCSRTPADAACAGRTSNDANLLVKVNVDRDCSQWLGCSSSESVFDPATGRYKDLCTNLALCDRPSDRPGDIFCSNYVDRSSTSTEPVLTHGAFFDVNQYNSRKIGLGERDYSGYSVPNSFLVADTVSARVAVDGLQNDSSIGYRYALDYRLVTAVSMPPARGTPPGPINHLRTPNKNEARILDNRTDIGRRYPDLRLCQHVGSNRIGYYRINELNASRPILCFLPISPTSDVYDFPTLSQKFALLNPEADPVLSRAFPSPECRAYPEVDSPYPAAFVTTWDTTKNPPKPVNKVSGFANANTCEFGEICSCSYKRADYTEAAVSKFYGVFSQNIPPGICQGGPRDGLSCLPESVFKAPTMEGLNTAEGRSTAQAVISANTEQNCGPVEGGGRCVAFSKVSIVRGVFGQCLERDITRNIGNDINQHPCLTWNPTPILFGEKDVYHYTPSAGYQPPENSGQYYCTSYARPPRSTKLDDTFFASHPFAGGVEKLSFDDYFVSHARLEFVTDPARLSIGVIAGSAVGGLALEFIVPGFGSIIGAIIGSLQNVGDFPGSGIDSLRPSGTRTAQLCSEARPFESEEGSVKDMNGLRIIGTGRYQNQSYAETFFAADSEGFAHWLFNLPTSTAATAGQNRLALDEQNFSFFTIKPIVNPNGNGRLACGYQEEWVENLGQVSYSDQDSLKNADKEWQQKFMENYDPNLTRASEKFFTRASGVGYKVPCLQTNPKDENMGTQCYLKTWDLSYRAENQTSATNFIGLYPISEAGQSDPNAPDSQLRSLNDLRRSPTYRQCESDKPYFMVRAVFQASADPTRQSSCSSGGTECRDTQVQGPWRFIGFWTVTCGGRISNDYRYIYMEITANSADICRDLAEVRSVNSRQDAAFTDRVWREGGYVVPAIGTQYSTRFSPFSSALNTKPAGKEPLFQTGTDRVGFSRLNPPNFLGAGVETYFRQTPYPRDKWAYLSNIFARIYRIYTYYDQPVTRQDNACLSGPFIGKRCTPPTSGARDACSINGVCDTNAILPGEGEGVRFCNAFSGINAGLRCNAQTRDQDSCHLGPMVRDTQTGDTKVLLSGCVLNPNVISQSDQMNRYRCGTVSGTGQTSGPRRIAGVGSPSDPDNAGNTGDVWTSSGNGYDGPCMERAGEPDPDQGLATEAAAARGAFVCDGASLRANQFCSRPGSQSAECPLKVQSVCATKTDPATGLSAKRCQFTTSTVPSLSSARALGFTLDENGFVNDDYPVCKENTDCAFDSWSFWHPGPIPYAFRTNFNDSSSTAEIAASAFGGGNSPNKNQVGEGGYSYLQRKPLDSGWLWGPIYSIRSTINYTVGALGQSGLDYCFNLNQDARVVTAMGGPAYGGDRLCLGVTTINAQGIAGGANPKTGTNRYNLLYDAYYDRPALGPYFDCRTDIGANCLSEGTVYNASDWDMQANIPGLWSNFNSDATRNLPAVRHNEELLRDPGVGEAVNFGYRDHGFGTGNNYYFNLGACESTERLSSSLSGTNFDGATQVQTASRGRYGRCVGGIYDGRICRKSAPGQTESPTSPFRCDAPGIPDYGVCGAVATDAGGGRFQARSGSVTTPGGSIVIDCRKGGSTGPGSAPDAQTDPDLDNNICTHKIGYYPRINLCPNPDNEYCGLISYNIAQPPAGGTRTGGSLDPRTVYPLPTDVTLGHYTPSFFGFTVPPAESRVTDFSYIGYYTPKPPRIAAPDIRNCPTPGQCQIQRLDQVSFNGQSEGIIGVAGGQHKSSIRFYAWASHEQMPIRQMVVDWGDGQKQELNDAKIRNHKPFCGVQKECYDSARGHSGLTCNTDSDCPAGAGVCLPLGNCSKRTNVVCSRDSDCTQTVSGLQVPDTCNIRTFFGNSPEACETNYFDFSHEYACEANASSALPPCSQVPGAASTGDVPANTCYFGSNDAYVLSDAFGGQRPSCTATTACTAAYNTAYGAGTAPADVRCNLPSGAARTERRCSRDPARTCSSDAGCAAGDSCIAGLAPPGGCWDEAALSCRYTPRVLIQDNWGWCGGECRNVISGGVLTDSGSSKVLHTYGGCYAGRPLNGDRNSVVRTNDRQSTFDINECDVNAPRILPGGVVDTQRPWIVYPGSLQLRRR